MLAWFFNFILYWSNKFWVDGNFSLQHGKYGVLFINYCIPNILVSQSMKPFLTQINKQIKPPRQVMCIDRLFWQLLFLIIIYDYPPSTCIFGIFTSGYYALHFCAAVTRNWPLWNLKIKWWVKGLLYTYIQLTSTSFSNPWPISESQGRRVRSILKVNANDMIINWLLV